MTVHKEDVMAALRDCYDPCCRDREISVVDMGLIENVCVEGSSIYVDMLLTTGWCPFVANLYSMMDERLMQLEGVEQVKIEVLWDPVWTMERLSDSARAKLSLPMDELLPVREQRLAEAIGG